ncbi:MAG TPA: DinB family protein [Clostridia bacterium]|nr:DinB family protein [Clostridia bacterium]
MSADIDPIRKEIAFQLRSGNAHLSFEEVIAGFPPKLRGTVPKGLPYSAWQLLGHIRITQEDILRFSRNVDGGYVTPNWPQSYWPESVAPPNDSAWEESVQQVIADREQFIQLVEKGDLFTPFPWGDGQTLLREAFVIIDHTAYHLGEIVAVRRLLGAWPSQ